MFLHHETNIYTTCSIPVHSPCLITKYPGSPWVDIPSLYSSSLSQCGHHKLRGYKDGRNIKSQFETNWNPQFVSAHPGNVFGELWLFVFGDLPPGFMFIGVFLFLHREMVPRAGGIYCPQKEFPERRGGVLTMQAVLGRMESDEIQNQPTLWVGRVLR